MTEYEVYYPSQVVYYRGDGWSIEKFSRVGPLLLRIFHNCTNAFDNLEDPYGGDVVYFHLAGFVLHAIVLARQWADAVQGNAHLCG